MLVVALVKGLTDTVDANDVFVMGMSPSSPYSSSSSLSPSACHHAPLPSSHGRAAYLIPPPSRPRVFGWLLRDKISNGGHLRPSSYFIFVIFFVVQFAAPK